MRTVDIRIKTDAEELERIMATIRGESLSTWITGAIKLRRILDERNNSENERLTLAFVESVLDSISTEDEEDA
jgi:hypothetical protein